VAVVVSDFLDPDGFAHAFKQLKHNRFEAFAVMLSDPGVLRPDAGGVLRLVDAETRDECPALITAELAEAVEHEFAEYCRRIERACLELGTGLIQASTRTPFEDLVLRFFREGGLLT
jgi:hypothetical protein